MAVLLLTVYVTYLSTEGKVVYPETIAGILVCVKGVYTHPTISQREEGCKKEGVV